MGEVGKYIPAIKIQVRVKIFEAYSGKNFLGIYEHFAAILNYSMTFRSSREEAVLLDSEMKVGVKVK